MSIYKISGTTTHGADVHVIQNDTYFGKKAVTAGNYEVTIDSTVASGITTVAKKSDGHTVSYGAVEAITSSGIADLSAIVAGLSIKNIQPISITIPNYQTSQTTTITAVDTDNTIILPAGYSTSLDSISLSTYLELLNSTTVRASSLGGTAYKTSTTNAYIVEFNAGGFTSINNGIVTIDSGQFTGTDTIPAVITSNCILIMTGRSTNANRGDMYGRLALTDTTTITATREANYAYVTTASYSLFEV